MNSSVLSAPGKVEIPIETYGVWQSTGLEETGKEDTGRKTQECSFRLSQIIEKLLRLHYGAGAGE